MRHMVIAGIMFLLLATGGVNVAQHPTAMRLAASDGIANPAPSPSPDRESEKHHGTSGSGPDTMGSGTKPMPGEPGSAKPPARPMGGTGGAGAGH